MTEVFENTEPDEVELAPEDAASAAKAFGADDSFIDDSAETSEEVEGALYPGDRGTLPFELRRLLIYLLRGPYFERTQDKRLWHLLLSHTDLVRSRLSDLLLDLMVDEASGIAFCRKADTGELQAPSLLPTVRLRFLDSAVLLELREKLLRANETGERAVVTYFELRDLLEIYDRASLSNESVFLKHLAGIVERLKRRRILLPLKGGDSFEISRVLPLLFTSADLESLGRAFREQAERAAQAAAAAPARTKSRRRARLRSTAEAAQSFVASGLSADPEDDAIADPLGDDFEASPDADENLPLPGRN